MPNGDTLTLTLISDPGHGWLRVPLALLDKYGVRSKITPYSFYDKQYAYLEEDCDAQTFFDAVKAAGDTLQWEHSYVGRFSRNRARFQE